jgi:hypothetical protein
VHAPAAALQPPTEHEVVAVEVAQPASTLTQAPLHRANPFAQTNVHAPLTHSAWALSSLVVHGLPHLEQSFALLDVSTQVPAHTVGMVEGQLAVHAYVPPALEHSGVLPVHLFPQLPQLAALEGSTQPSAHGRRPAPQSGRGAAPASAAGSALSSTVAVASAILPPASTHPLVHVPAL